MTFARGPAGTGTGGERRAIRYAVIPLLDRPDEIQAMRLGELAAGDEVEVQQRSGAYCHVVCPDGREGWVHRTTLGDVIAPSHERRQEHRDQQRARGGERAGRPPHRARPQVDKRWKQRRAGRGGALADPLGRSRPELIAVLATDLRR